VRKTHELCSCCGSLLSPGVDKATRQQRNEPRDMRVNAIHSLHRVRWARPTLGNTILGAVMLYLKSCQAAKRTRASQPEGIVLAPSGRHVPVTGGERGVTRGRQGEAERGARVSRLLAVSC
jgi:hypothetical protein